MKPSDINAIHEQYTYVYVATSYSIANKLAFSKILLKQLLEKTSFNTAKGENADKNGKALYTFENTEHSNHIISPFKIFAFSRVNYILLPKRMYKGHNFHSRFMQ